jgi:hypothetical protein
MISNYLALSSEVNISLINAYQWVALHYVLYLKNLQIVWNGRLKIDNKWIRLSIFWIIIYWRENGAPKIVNKLCQYPGGFVMTLGSRLQKKKQRVQHVFWFTWD